MITPSSYLSKPTFKVYGSNSYIDEVDISFHLSGCGYLASIVSRE